MKGGIDINYVSFYYTCQCFNNKTDINQPMLVKFARYIYAINIPHKF